MSADETRPRAAAAGPDPIPVGLPPNAPTADGTSPAVRSADGGGRAAFGALRAPLRPSPAVRSTMVSVRSAVFRGAALAVGGALVGYAFAAVVAGLVSGGSLTGRPAEPPVTRAYIDALVDRDVTRLAELQPPADIGTRAAQIQRAYGAERWTTKALSYLGGATLGPVGVYLYVIDVKSPDGTVEQTVPFTFTVVEQKIVRVQ